MSLATREFLTIGPAHVLLEDIVYGMPARAVRVHATAAVEISVNGTDWEALTNAETVGADAGSVFIRAPDTGGATVTLRAY